MIRRILAADLPAMAYAGRDHGPGDDAAFLADPGIVISTDLSIEGVHFQREWLSMRELGRRVSVVALSDLAAMAATPVGLLLSIALPSKDTRHLTPFYDGVGDALRESGAVLLGGDLSRSPGPWFADVVAVGRSLKPIRRDGAAIGHEIWVTGTLGGPAAAVRGWLDGEAVTDAARRSWAQVAARTDEALWLADAVSPSALIDLSDGLSGDAAHVAAASGVALVIELSEVPVASLAGGGDVGIDLALHGGEDYELLLTAPPGRVGPRTVEFEARFGAGLTRIGIVEEGEGVWGRSARGADRERLLRRGFSHWEEEGT